MAAPRLLPQYLSLILAISSFHLLYVVVVWIREDQLSANLAIAALIGFLASLTALLSLESTWP